MPLLHLEATDFYTLVYYPTLSVATFYYTPVFQPNSTVAPSLVYSSWLSIPSSSYSNHLAGPFPVAATNLFSTIYSQQQLSSCLSIYKRQSSQSSFLPIPSSSYRSSLDCLSPAGVTLYFLSVCHQQQMPLCLLAPSGSHHSSLARPLLIASITLYHSPSLHNTLGTSAQKAQVYSRTQQAISLW